MPGEEGVELGVHDGENAVDGISAAPGLGLPVGVEEGFGERKGF